MPQRPLFAAALCAMVSACGGGGFDLPAPPPKAKPIQGPVRSPVRYTPPATPRPQAPPGLESVIGARAEDLLRLFGPARLDISEGDARKLQFSGPACVLDVYLYPLANGQPAQASFVDARRASDGLEVDRVACVNALRKR